MKNNHRLAKITGISILSALVVFSVFALVLQNFIKGFDPTSYISTISTLSIAILTVVYVLTTSGQLDVMRQQLNEMETARRVDSQPLPVVTLEKIELEPPRLFYSPPEDEHAFQSRLMVDFSVKNHSSFPAVNITASGAVVLRTGKIDETFYCTSERIDVLAAGEQVPASPDSSYPDFMFTGDSKNKILSRLRSRKLQELPFLQIHITFTNILGGCFALDIVYQLVPKKIEDDEVLRKWHTMCSSFEAQHGNTVIQLEKLKKTDKVEEWEDMFYGLRDSLKDEAGEEKLALRWMQIPGSFQIRTITQGQLENEMKKVGFGRVIPDWAQECPHAEE